ncbi:MAG: hypothetical protein GY796_10195 [Chloroflexi bacterium]|nr:hypothetical protein [Chloroflexota bacterium]
MQYKDKQSLQDPIWIMWRTQIAEAAQTPWLASLLLKRSQRLWARFIHFFQRLASLPHHKRRALGRNLQSTLAGMALALALSGVPSVHAAAITVDSEVVVKADDNQCSLIEAIINANNDSQLYASDGECDAGSGNDIISLSTATHTLTDYDNSTYGYTGLPVISSTITINGNGATIERSGDAISNFRILAVNATGNLTLNNATITGGNIYDDGSGMLNYGGTIAINNSTISNNTAAGNGGGIHNIAYTYNSLATAVVTINNSTISGNSAKSGGGVSNHARTYSGEATATATINNSTISGNTAGNFGGGAYIKSGTESGTVLAAVTFNRSLVSGNTAKWGREVNNSDTVTADNNNLFGYDNDAGVTGFSPGVSDIVPGAGIVVANILNTTLANNSLNENLNTPEYPDTHALVSGSPAIDKAPDTDCTNAPTGNVDQRGGVRNVDGDSSLSANECDIGAFEYGSTPTPTSVTMQGGMIATGGGTDVPLALGTTGSLALLSAGLLARTRRRREKVAGGNDCAE